MTLGQRKRGGPIQGSHPPNRAKSVSLRLEISPASWVGTFLGIANLEPSKRGRNKGDSSILPLPSRALWDIFRSSGTPSDHSPASKWVKRGGEKREGSGQREEGEKGRKRGKLSGRIEKKKKKSFCVQPSQILPMMINPSLISEHFQRNCSQGQRETLPIEYDRRKE